MTTIREAGCPVCDRPVQAPEPRSHVGMVLLATNPAPNCPGDRAGTCPTCSALQLIAMQHGSDFPPFESFRELRAVAWSLLASNAEVFP